ncbi:MAG: hypothetical protein KBG47_00090 [Bacteroidia bacterium]|nr:hypothetical protein [Sphingobacteriaceae bacterium]MBP9067874.1 hypothetical protein [Bacteroidia bacterium]
MFRSASFALIFIVFSLGIGAIGYHIYFQLPWVDSFYNASLILTGMGPVDKAPDDSAKIFASIYSIYSGVAFLTSVAVLFSPVFHRFLHKFRLDVEE